MLVIVSPLSSPSTQQHQPCCRDATLTTQREPGCISSIDGPQDHLEFFDRRRIGLPPPIMMVDARLCAMPEANLSMKFAGRVLPERLTSSFISSFLSRYQLPQCGREFPHQQGTLDRRGGIE